MRKVKEGNHFKLIHCFGGLVVKVMDDPPQDVLGPGGAALGERHDPDVIGPQLEVVDSLVKVPVDEGGGGSNTSRN